MTETFQRVQGIIAEHLGLDESEIKLESSIKDDLGADSLDAVEIVMELEDEFDIEITDEEAEKMQKVSDIVTFIDAYNA